MTATAPEGSTDGAAGPTSASAPHRRLALRLPAGLVDSGASSLATFAAGIVANRLFNDSPDYLGAYGLFFASFLVASIVSNTGVFTPIEVRSLDLPREQRPRLILQSVRSAGIVSFGIALIVCPATLLVPSSVPIGARVALAAAATALSAISPIQDHLRRLYHQADRSWGAAGISSVQVLSVAVIFSVAGLAGFTPSWMPIAGLAAANVVSAGAGLTWALRNLPPPPDLRLRLGQLLHSGKWILSGTFAQQISAYLVVAIVTIRSGADQAGYVEAARVISQPVTVFIVGIMAVLSPELMAAGRQLDGARVGRIVRLLYGGVALLTVGWLVVAAVPWPHSPLTWISPLAFEVDWLLPVVIVGQAIGYATLVFSSVLIGARRERVLAAADVVAPILAVSLALAFGDHGAMAAALAALAGVTGLTVVKGFATHRVLQGRA